MKNSSLIATLALISTSHTYKLDNSVTFNLPDGTSLVYQDEGTDDHQKIELIVSDFGSKL